MTGSSAGACGWIVVRWRRSQPPAREHVQRPAGSRFRYVAYITNHRCGDIAAPPWRVIACAGAYGGLGSGGDPTTSAVGVAGQGAALGHALGASAGLLAAGAGAAPAPKKRGRPKKQPPPDVAASLGLPAGGSGSGAGPSAWGLGPGGATGAAARDPEGGRDGDDDGEGGADKKKKKRKTTPKDYAPKPGTANYAFLVCAYQVGLGGAGPHLGIGIWIVGACRSNLCCQLRGVGEC